MPSALRPRLVLAALGLGLGLFCLLGVRPLLAAFGDAAAISDPLYAYQWPLNNTGQVFPPGCSGGSCLSGTPDADMDWAEAYDLGFSGDGVIIAIAAPQSPPVSTSNVKCMNPDLVGNLWSDPLDPSVHGHDFTADSSDVCVMESGSNHDTDVARLALGAVNGVDSVGVAPQAKLMILMGVFTETDFYNEALPWAEARGARVIFFPYTSFTPMPDCATYGAAPPLYRAQKLASSNVLVIWGCPNQYPGCDPSAVSIGTTDENDDRHLDSCAQDSSFMDFAAPGGRGWVTSTAPLGASYAIGHAAGVSALVLQENAALTRAQLLTRLQQTADDVGPFPYSGGRNNQYGHGRLNAYRALLVGDVDGDGVPGDGNGSWIVGDDPCAGSTSGCDDNCPVEPNPGSAGQADSGGINSSSADGTGNACQCGDVTNDGRVLALDATRIREFLAGLSAPPALDKCNVHGTPGGDADDCNLDDWVVVRRALAGAPTTVSNICGPALP